MASVERLKDHFPWVNEHFSCRPATMWISKYRISSTQG